MKEFDVLVSDVLGKGLDQLKDAKSGLKESNEGAKKESQTATPAQETKK